MVLFFLASTQFVLGQHSLPAGFPSNIRLGGVVHGEIAISALGNRMPEVAAFYRKTPDELRALFRADHSLKADPQGQLFFVCKLQIETNAPDQGATIESITPIDNPPFSTSETFLLHSRPGANRVIYLDFDGHKDTTGRWGTNAVSPPFDLDGNTNSFSSTERDRIVYIWQRVAEDYSMYDIDVTTEDPGIEALRKTSSSDQIYGVRVVIGGSYSDWYGSASGGVAYVGSFDDSKDVPCWVFAKSVGSSEKNITEAASHEAGHTLGLIHDGTTTGSSYYKGQGSWAPIMGVGYSKPIVQWSKGEYADANNTEDDLAVMLNYGAVFRTDDHGNSIATATALATGSTIGVIEKNTDLDFFSFVAAGGPVTISVTRAPRDSDLHMQVILYGSAGTPILTNTPADSSSTGTQSAVSTLSLSAGTYYLSVAGVGNGDPLTTGYSDYASLGQYTATVSGTVPSGSVWLPVAAGTYSWTNTLNWSPSPPNDVGFTASVNNNIVGNQTINLPTAITLGTLNLGDANDTHTFAIRSTGGSLTFNNGSSTGNLNKSAGLGDVIAVPLMLAGNLTINHSSIGALTLSGPIDGGGSLTNKGTGTTLLAGTNSYSGSTTIMGGVLRLGNTNALPAGNLVISGGVLGLASGDFTDRTVGTGPSQVRWTDDGGFAAYGAPRQVRFSTNSINWTAANFIGGNTLILGANDSDATLQWLQAISLAGSGSTIQVNDGSANIDALMSGSITGGALTNYVTHLVKTGGGTLAITSQPTYWGDTIVSDGTLMLGNGTSNSGGVSENSANIDVSAGATLAVNRTGTLTQGDNALRVAISGEGGFAQVGSGTTVFTRANNYTGPTTISAGKLKLGAANVIPDGINSGNVTVAGTLDLNGFSETINGLSGAGIVDTAAGGAPTLTVGNGNGSGVFTGTIRNTVGTLALVKTGTGTLELQGSNIFSGGVTIKNGTVNSRITTTTLGTGTVVMGGAGSTNATFITGKNNTNAFIINAPSSGTNTIGANGIGSGFILSGPITLNGDLVFQNYTNTFAGGFNSSSTLSGGITGTGNLLLKNLGNNTNTITLSGVNSMPINHTGGITVQGASLGNTTISAVIGANVTGVTQNSAKSTLVLSAANTFAGNTTINAGTLRLAAGGTIENSASIIVGTVPGTVAILDATAAGIAIRAGQTLKGHGAVTGSVTNAGTLAPGTSIGKLTFINNLFLNAGSTNIFEVNGSTPTNDVVSLGGTVTYGGVLKIVPSGTFTDGQTFTLFIGAGATSASNFGSIVGSPGAGLSFSFTNGLLAVVSTGVVTPSSARLTNSVSGNTLNLSWPAGQGWRLQMQTNGLAVGLSTNWVEAAGASVNTTNVTIDSTTPTVFYRLVYP